MTDRYNPKKFPLINSMLFSDSSFAIFSGYFIKGTRILETSEIENESRLPVKFYEFQIYKTLIFAFSASISEHQQKKIVSKTCLHCNSYLIFNFFDKSSFSNSTKNQDIQNYINPSVNFFIYLLLINFRAQIHKRIRCKNIPFEWYLSGESY